MFSWSEYNEKLVKRGEILFDIEHCKYNTIGERPKEMRKGRPHKFPNTLFRYPTLFYPPSNNYQHLEGLCRKLNKVIPKFPTPDHTTIERRIEVQKNV